MNILRLAIDGSLCEEGITVTILRTMIESQGARGSRPQEDPLAEAPIACHELDREGRVIWVNEAECSLLGLDREQMVGRHIWDFVSPGEQEASSRAVMRKLAAEEPLLV